MDTISFSLYSILLIFVIIQGFLLGTIFLFNPKYKRRSNLPLVFVLFALALMGIGNLFYETELSKNYPILSHLPLNYVIAIPIGIYYFVILLFTPDYQFKKQDYWFVIPFGFQLIGNVVFFLIYLFQSEWLIANNEIYQGFHHFMEVVALIYCLVVIFIVLKKISQYHNQLLDNFSEIEGKSLIWLRNTAYGILLLCVVWLLSLVNNIYFNGNLLAPMWICNCLIIYWLGYFVMLRRDLFEIPQFKPITEQNAKKTPLLSDKTEEHYKNLLQLIEEDKLYRDPLLSMDLLAEKTNLSNGYLSQIINQKEGKNFYDFINSYRVKEVKANLVNPEFDHYSILGIGLDAGFKSKSTFNAVFKKMTGLTPSKFRRGKR